MQQYSDIQILYNYWTKKNFQKVGTKYKVKQSRYRPGVAQRVPGS
jgi:hypothetical protein